MLSTYLGITDNKWFEYLQWSKFTGDASQGGGAASTSYAQGKERTSLSKSAVTTVAGGGSVGSASG